MDVKKLQYKGNFGLGCHPLKIKQEKKKRKNTCEATWIIY